MTTFSDVLFEELPGKGGHLGVMTLNRPQALNALNLAMIHAIHQQLDRWVTDAKIKAVVIRAAPGRAFCAGGDLRWVYEGHQAKDKNISQFFHDEYQLNRFIFHYPKPYIALLDGITMGGGAGISLPGSHRIATEKLLFAMPETGIGFLPDVGGTYFLPRLKGRIGYYLGLTGARIDSETCVALNLAQFKVSSHQLADLIQALAESRFSEDASQSVTQIIMEFNLATATVLHLSHQQEINECFNLPTIEAIIAALQQSSLPFFHQITADLLKKSPTSLKVTLRALQLGETLDFDACLSQEYQLACRFLQAHDFFEGIRALIIDKDQTPHWQPPTLEKVTPTIVEKYFSSMVELD